MQTNSFLKVNSRMRFYVDYLYIYKVFFIKTYQVRTKV